MKRERADRLLVLRGIAESRQRAQALILAGVIFSGSRRVEKTAEPLPVDADLRMAADPQPFVGRGGLKLEAALDGFEIDPSGCVALDVGASTGGFTDCLLKRGASRVIALDVGRGQLHWKLRQDSRVDVRENINARRLPPNSIPERIHLATVDVSFISLRLVVPAVRLAAHPEEWILLVKPQFEVGRREVERGGLVTDPKKHRRVLQEMLEMARGEELVARGIIPSPIRGAKGNREFLIHLGPGPLRPDPAQMERWIEEAIA